MLTNFLKWAIFTINFNRPISRSYSKSHMVKFHVSFEISCLLNFTKSAVQFCVTCTKAARFSTATYTFTLHH